MRRAHPRWGPRRIRAELAKRREFAEGRFRAPHRSSIYRILVRFNLLTVQPRRRKRSEYKRWQRDEVTRTKGYGVRDRVGVGSGGFY